MPYSATELTSLITTLGTFIGVVVAAVLAVITALKTKQIAVEQVAIKEQVQVVHDQTNSYLSKIESQLKASQDSLASAVLEIEHAEEARFKLASEAALVLRQTPLIPVAPPQIIVVSEKGQVIG